MSRARRELEASRAAARERAKFDAEVMERILARRGVSCPACGHDVCLSGEPVCPKCGAYLTLGALRSATSRSVRVAAGLTQWVIRVLPVAIVVAAGYYVYRTFDLVALVMVGVAVLLAMLAVFSFERIKPSIEGMGWGDAGPLLAVYWAYLLAVGAVLVIAVL